jgi:hypothetical protein
MRGADGRLGQIDIGGQLAIVPGEREEWISLRAGESRDHLHLLLGLDPRHQSEISGGFVNRGVLMFGWGNEELPKQFGDLFILELLPD